MTARWYIADRTEAHWPGLGRFRGIVAAQKGKGYASEDDALRVVSRLMRQHARQHGANGPDLRARLYTPQRAG